MQIKIITDGNVEMAVTETIAPLETTEIFQNTLEQVSESSDEDAAVTAASSDERSLESIFQEAAET